MGRVHQLGNLDKGSAVFLFGRCIHDDTAAVREIDAEVTPKTGVGGGNADRRGVQLVGGRQLPQPGVEISFALDIWPSWGCDRCGFGGVGVAHG